MDSNIINDQTQVSFLDTLKEKQKLKEFRRTTKELKSKDIDTRNNGLLKLKDLRYLIDGGCFSSLLESIAPNKVLKYIYFYLFIIIYVFSGRNNCI